MKIYSLPSSEWFEEMYGPLNNEDTTTDSGISGCSKAGSSSAKKRRQMKSKLSARLAGTSSKTVEVIDVSDGEDLYDVFPLDSVEASTNAASIQHQNVLGDVNVQEEELVVLFERKSKKLVIKEVSQ